MQRRLLRGAGAGVPFKPSDIELFSNCCMASTQVAVLKGFIFNEACVNHRQQFEKEPLLRTSNCIGSGDAFRVIQAERLRSMMSIDSMRCTVYDMD